MVSVIVPDGPSSFVWDGSTPVFTSDGSPHVDYSTMGSYIEAILLRSTGVLFGLDPADTILRTFPLERS